MPKAVVIDNAFNWDGDRKPGRPLAESIIYEVHVKVSPNYVRGFRRNCVALTPGSVAPGQLITSNIWA
jgi:1,4-alpha-glucan branching enzyme